MIRMAEIEMVVVDGVRYRPEDAPKEKASAAKKREPDTEGGDVKTRARTARSASSK